MIVTEIHAKGLVRTLVRVQSETTAERLRELVRRLQEIPRKRTRLGRFVGDLERQLSEGALLCRSRADKRRASLSVVLPSFADSERGWVMRLDWMAIGLRANRSPLVRTEPSPYRLCGHALERMFQRTRTVDWRTVLEELAPTVTMLPWLNAPVRALGLRQLAVQTRSGLLIGAVEDDAVIFKTFVLGGLGDAERLQALRRDLWGFWILHGGGNALARVFDDPSAGDERVGESLKHLLSAHSWLALPHLPGEDRESIAWAARRETVGTRIRESAPLIG